MKRAYICILLLIAAAGYSQEKISSDLSVAVKESPFSVNSFSKPDFSYYNRNFDRVFNYRYTFDKLDTGKDRIYVEGDKFYSNTYVPIVLQQQHSNLMVNDYYRYEKMYAQPDVPAMPQVKP